MMRTKNASIECRPEIVGKSAANEEQIVSMSRALARDKGILVFDLRKIRSEADRLYLRSLARRVFGYNEIGGPI